MMVRASSSSSSRVDHDGCTTDGHSAVVALSHPVCHHHYHYQRRNTIPRRGPIVLPLRLLLPVVTAIIVAVMNHIQSEVITTVNGFSAPTFHRSYHQHQQLPNGNCCHTRQMTTSNVAAAENDDLNGGGVESYGSVSASSSSLMMVIQSKLFALYKFTRPHTIRGTILASICGTIRALRDTPDWWTTTAIAAGSSAGTTTLVMVLRNMLPRAFIGMLALLFGNAFIVGINQIYDQSIDKMNKPFLPIVSGEMNTNTAWLIVSLSAIIGPILVYQNFPTILFQLYSFGLFLGLIYSVPPIRTKQNPILAGLTIASVRGLLLNFGIYYAVKDTFARNSFTWSPHVSFIARFMTIFATIIAITKDLPDLEGDKANQIETFVTKFGIANIAKGATVLLFGNYIHAIMTGIVQRTIFAPLPMIGGHAVLASILLYRYRQLQPNSMASVKHFYKHIWDLFYLEYGLYTII